MPIPAEESGLDRSLLRDHVFRRLSAAIETGVLKPGERLRDLDLATWLGCSRTPVREALLRLGDCGLVRSSPGRSTTVTLLDGDAVRDASDVVAALHGVAVRQAVPRLTAEDLRTMREANQRFRKALRDGDLEAAIVADDELHGVPVTVADNGALRSVLEQYTPVLRRSERLRFSTLAVRGSASRHDTLIRLCAAGDVDGAAAASFETWHQVTVEPTPPN